MTSFFPRRWDYAVGGVSASNLDEWLSAELAEQAGVMPYRPDSPEECLRKSRLMVGAYQATLKE